MDDCQRIEICARGLSTGQAPIGFRPSINARFIKGLMQLIPKFGSLDGRPVQRPMNRSLRKQ